MKKFRENSANSIVKRILTNSIEARDNDPLLYEMYLISIGYSPSIPTDLFLRLVRNKTIQCPSVIFRRRRGIQKLFPDLRGKSYNKRNHIHTESFKEELGYPNKNN